MTYNLSTNPYDPPVTQRPWERVEEASKYLKFVAEGAIPASVFTDMAEDEVQQFAKCLSGVFRFMKDDYSSTLQIRRAITDEDRCCTPLENNLAKLALMLIGTKEVSG